VMEMARPRAALAGFPARGRAGSIFFTPRAKVFS